MENAASLEQIAGVPFCHPCAEYARNRPFPKWLIWSLSALILLVAVAWVRNERFFRALILMRREQAAMERADLARSEELAVRAAALVPESDALAGVAAFQKGLRALQRDRSSEAVPLLLRAHSAFPDSKNISYLLASAEAGAAFESKKWDVFLQKALEVEKLEPGEPKSVAQVASAYACLYAAAGHEDARHKAEEYLERASRLSKPGDPDFAEYNERIRYRLDTRQILTRDQYMRMRHPDLTPAVKP